MIKSISYQEGYQQALHDFGISDLLGKLSTFWKKSTIPSGNKFRKMNRIQSPLC